ncbi:MAG: hypothetical protein WC581_12070 [Thermodesulfovibrionales bacterium]
MTSDKYFDKKINMNYKNKTKEQLINESAELHRRIEDLEAETTKREKAEFISNVYLVDHKRRIFILDNNK